MERILKIIEEGGGSPVADIEDLSWDTHLALFPLVQRVLNPPYINPHLPKMYGVIREFLPYLEKSDIPGLVRLEFNEYARRPKLDELPTPRSKISTVAFPDIAAAIGDGERGKVAALLAAFVEQKGAAELARNLLLLGSGYLGHTLGHSVSCTAFILLEMLARPKEDLWPVLGTLADYYCKGKFDIIPRLQGKAGIVSPEHLRQELLRATSGRGIVNLHHTITFYAVERTRRLLTGEEYAHMIASCSEFMGSKRAEIPPKVSPEPLPDYDSFFKRFSNRDESVISGLIGMLTTKESRRELGRYLIKGVSDMYQGSYDPHFITGLGSVLWVIENYRNDLEIVTSALRQYLDYFWGWV